MAKPDKENPQDYYVLLQKNKNEDPKILCDENNSPIKFGWINTAKQIAEKICRIEKYTRYNVVRMQYTETYSSNYTNIS